MFIPTYAVELSSRGQPKIKLGLQGDSGTGKTFAALSFPNPIVADFDENLSRFADRQLPVISFVSAEFMEKFAEGKFKAKKSFPEDTHNVKDAFIQFIYNDARKIDPEQTLIIDSWSSIMDHVNNWYCAHPVMVRKEDGTYAEDGRKMYAEYKDFATIAFTGIKALKCNVVVTFHEHKMRDKITGNLIDDKIAPLMEGSYKDQIKKHFTEFFRCVQVDGKFFVQVKSDKKFDAITRAALKNKEILYDVTGPERSAYGFFQEYYPSVK